MNAAVAADALPLVNPLFDADWYVARYADVARSGIEPWRHYHAFGAFEGRDPNPLFDSDWYLARYPEVRIGRANPLTHYWEYGALRGCNPNSLFDSHWYAARNPDVRRQGLNPLLHYLESGAGQGRDPSPYFDSAWYLASNPDLKPGALTPLGDYLLYGRVEGRSPLRYQVASRRWPSSRNGRIAVYTAITGSYDCLKIPTEIDPACDYICFTDGDISWQNVWQRREMPWRHADATRMCRHVKLHPHEYFKDYEWSLWLDGNLQLACSPQALLPPGDDWDLAVWRHPYRDCIYAEGAQCIVDEKDDATVICAQMQRYRDAGYPANAGLAESCVLARRHHAPPMLELAGLWWREMERGSRRDQLSLDFVMRGRNLRIAYLGEPGSNVREDRRLRYFLHNQRRR
jgi:O-antigen biosynthesis protein